MRTQKQAGLFSAPTPKSPLSSFSQASKTMTTSHFSKIFHQFAKKRFTKCGGFWHYFAVVAKSTAEPGNSKHLSVAQNTPIACFFMRSAHAPQERLARPSMVACSGKGFALCCFPLMTVPARYTLPPSLETSSGNFQSIFQWSYANVSIHFCRHTPNRSYKPHSKNPHYRRQRAHRPQSVR